MSVRVVRVLRSRPNFLSRTFATKSPSNVQKSNPCIISCKRRQFDHYVNTTYNSLDEIPLASKGWTHNKSKGDFFTINPLPEDHQEESVDFSSLDISKPLIKVLASKGILKATEFQAKAMSKMSTGSHLQLAAETGCGKTVAYLLPIIQNLLNQPKSTEMNAPKALILVPNRELAYQVGEFASLLALSVDMNVKIVVGGRTKKVMMNPTFGDIDILVGTPGAIGKLSGVGVYKLDQVLYTVLDEADTLIDDSFIERMEGILKRVSQSKIVLVSATLPKNLPEVLKPIEASMASVISSKLHKPLVNITQKFLRMTRSGKSSHLLEIAKGNKHPMLVFTNRNETCHWLAMFLKESNVSCANINGDMNYADRIEQWNKFIRGEVKILSATDVGSRGLDTVQVRHVLNYDFPLYAADYLHRIGRVGRLGSHQSCKATNFISGPEEVKLVQQIELAIRKNQPLTNVDGNITNIVQRKIARRMRQTA